MDAMTRPTRLLSLLVATLLAGLGLVIGSPLRAVAAPPAATDTGPIKLELLKVTPESLGPDATVTVQGRLTNVSKKPVKWVSIAMWRDFSSITTMDELRWALKAPPGVPGGSRMTSEGSFVTLNTKTNPDFKPGTRTHFTLRAKVSDLRLTAPRPGSVHLLGVHVRGIPADGSNQTITRARFIIPWQPDTASQNGVAPVVQLTSAPARGVDGAFTDDHLAHELTGRLRSLMQAAEMPGATVLVDPSLVDDLTAMSKGYTVAGKDVPATDQRALQAAQWIERLERVRVTGTLYRTPYGNPDLAAAAAANDTAVRDRVRGAMPPKHALADLPLAIWLPGNATLTPSVLRWLEPLKPKLWVEPSEDPGRYTVGGAQLLRYDGTITTGGPGPEPKDSLPQRTGRLLGQMVLTEGPVVLPVRGPGDVAMLGALPTWAPTKPLTDVPASAEAPPASPAVSRPTRKDLRSELDTLHRRIIAWHDLIGSQDNGRLAADQTVSRAMNPLLPEQDAIAWLRSAAGSVPTQFGGGVSIQVAGSFVMGDRTTTLPITVTNKSRHPVRVKVVMTSDNAARINIPDTKPVTIGPGESTTVTFRPEATTNGVVGFTAQLRTEQGRPIGRSQRFSVNATNFGQVGWLIIIASGAVLLGGSAMRIKQVQRERAKRGQPIAATPRPRRDITARPHP